MQDVVSLVKWCYNIVMERVTTCHIFFLHLTKKSRMYRAWYNFVRTNYNLSKTPSFCHQKWIEILSYPIFLDISNTYSTCMTWQIPIDGYILLCNVADCCHLPWQCLFVKCFFLMWSHSVISSFSLSYIKSNKKMMVKNQHASKQGQEWVTGRCSHILLSKFSKKSDSHIYLYFIGIIHMALITIIEFFFISRLGW